MKDRWVVMIVSLLTLIVMCALLVAAARWVPGQIDRLDQRIEHIEKFDATLQVMHNKLSEFDDLRRQLSAVRGNDTAAPLARIDKQVDELTVKMNQVVTGVNKIKTLAGKADVDRIAARINQIETRISATPKSDPELKRLTAEVKALKTLAQSNRKALEKKVDDVKGEIKRMNLQIQKLEIQIKRIPTGS